jgi:hypothetical protein
VNVLGTKVGETIMVLGVGEKGLATRVEGTTFIETKFH